MNAVRRALARFPGDIGVPSASIAVRVDRELVYAETVGWAARDPDVAAVEDQPYDLASLTKPLAGATVAAALVEDGALAWSDPARRWVPEADPRLVVGHLLDHVGGFPAWAPLHDAIPADRIGTDEARARIVELACRSAVAPPGGAEVYSDLGFLALLRIVEAVGGARLDALLASRVDTAALRWGWPGAAATEVRTDRGPIAGMVHDPLAYAMGGVSTHAGLFGTARGVAALAEALVDAIDGRRRDVPGRGLAPLVAGRASGHRGGWDGASPRSAIGLGSWPAGTLGHLGYTGTSVWVTPEPRVVVALLTNRIHPRDDPPSKSAITVGRAAVHDAVARELGWSR